MKYWCLFILIFFHGCASRTFRDLGNGAGVSEEAINDYAEEHNLTHSEAVAELRQQANEQQTANPQ